MLGFKLINLQGHYIMSIELVNLSFQQKNLTSSEHSILNVLCFRANDKNECWPSSKSLQESTSLDKKTVYKALVNLSNKGLIVKTGEMKGKTKSTPVYKISLPNFGSAQNLSVPNFSASIPKNGSAKRTQKRVMERSLVKVKEKQAKIEKYKEEGAQHIKNILDNLYTPKRIRT
jgi:pyocin large subunit-like protein